MFSPFIPDYADVAAPLEVSTSSKFDWSNEGAVWELRTAFRVFKEKLQSYQALFYPDYSLEWIVRWDASVVALASAFFQVQFVIDFCVFFPIKKSQNKTKYY